MTFQYLALLRGINVGGKNLVKMADLRAAVEPMGFADVATYIASGNLLFRAPRQRREELAARIESELTSRFGVELKVVLLTEAQLKAMVEGAPRGFVRAEAADGEEGVRSGRDPGGRRPRLAGEGRPLLLAARREGHEQPAQQGRLAARVQEHDHPQLEHDDEAAGPDGVEGRPASLTARSPWGYSRDKP
jgi:hypothetical protein